jgi:hypothetical protein
MTTADIALKLQRLGGKYRTKGLDLFETLLDLDTHDAQATLQGLDKRPRAMMPRPMNRRRRSRR